MHQKIAKIHFTNFVFNVKHTAVTFSTLRIIQTASKFSLLLNQLNKQVVKSASCLLPFFMFKTFSNMFLSNFSENSRMSLIEKSLSLNESIKLATKSE